MIDVGLSGVTPGSGAKSHVCVTKAGELIVAPVEYDESSFNLLDTVDTAYNFYVPKPGKQFVITGFTYKADRDVSNTVDATVVIYEATSATTATVTKTIHEDRLIRGEGKTITGIRRLVAAGRWINAKTDDDDVPMTIFGYYIPEL